ncbi:MAG: VanZ family protein [Candidatus Chisholmbacteria bacterium]|nr:VanZ family protein [Candidatus Chisholmbacteria bacterium]
MAKFKLWGPSIIWAVLIFTLSSIPTLPKVEIIWWDYVLKKSAHMFEYAVLFFLLVRALTKTRLKKASPKIFLLAGLITILYAISDEWHQTFVPGRGGRLTDVGYDTMGMVLSFLYIKSKVSKTH